MSKRKYRRLLAAALTLATLNWLFPQHALAAVPAPKPLGGYLRAAPPLIQLPLVASVPVKRRIRLTVTAYSSTIDQTDSDPFTTASGTTVHHGTLAYNFLPFGTKVRLPDAFGDTVFVVEDRMSARHGRYRADIWMPTRQAAKEWGRRTQTLEILDE